MHDAHGYRVAPFHTFSSCCGATWIDTRKCAWRDTHLGILLSSRPIATATPNQDNISDIVTKVETRNGPLWVSIRRYNDTNSA